MSGSAHCELNHGLTIFEGDAVPERVDWWTWPFLLTAHAQFRMEERGLDEIGLRRLLAGSGTLEANHRPGRWRFHGRTRRLPWTVVLEPNEESRTVLVITVFRIWS